ncbi:ubiquinol-cytochrome C chaperone family protein [Novosphingobium sp.]|uniref:ubiquinol-cytochrome C chaperone family protein n=1 Tax=Novosphingobium sp. TaxID=1874826 RepID=UPI0025F3673D|nr:ubiquinol-cytochrome C chaperone family protein [Novosphingobium sp.]
MSFLSRLTRSRRDDAADLRPLWHRVVEISREKVWYQDGQVADTVPGRFDAISIVLSAVLLRMEREDALHVASTRLTELFVTDMDGQLRQGGVGDLMVGKHIAKLMSTLGGRIGALRDALAMDDHALGDAALAGAIERNITLVEGGDPAAAVALLRGLVRDIDATDAEALLAGRIAR